MGFSHGLEGQSAPGLHLTLSGDSTPAVVVTAVDVLTDDRFIGAMESGFPLYVEFRVELRQPRSLWDRTVARAVWERVVLYDPVRARYVLEDPDGTEIVADRAALERRLAGPWRVLLASDDHGRFYYRAVVRARTLSDQDVDEVFAWLKGEDVETVETRRPGFLTRVARRLLVEVAPLPSLELQARSATFAIP
jgi:hypothetical protein